MTFHSLDFLAFSLIITAVYWRLSHGAQNWFLLAASYLFYGWVEPWFCLLVAGTTVVDWWVALKMDPPGAAGVDVPGTDVGRARLDGAAVERAEDGAELTR